MLLDPEMEQFLHSGCALIIGIVSGDGEPFALRGWGLTVLGERAPEPTSSLRVRVLVDSQDPTATDLLETGCSIAITAANVITLRSVQLKGRVVAVEATTDADRAKQDDYTEQFFGDIVRSEQTPRSLLEGFRPLDIAPCIVRVDELFDQTPGPDAGARIQPRVA